MDGRVAFPGARHQAAFSAAPVQQSCLRNLARLVQASCFCSASCSAGSGVGANKRHQGWFLSGRRGGGQRSFRRVRPGCATDATCRPPGSPPGRRCGRPRRRRRHGPRQITVAPGWAFSHVSRVAASRSGSRSTVVAGVDVHQHGPVHLPLAQCEVIHPEHLGGDGDLGARGGAATRRSTVDGCTGTPSKPRQPGGGAPGQFQPEPGQHRQQRHAAPPVAGR